MSRPPLPWAGPPCRHRLPARPPAAFAGSNLARARIGADPCLSPSSSAPALLQGRWLLLVQHERCGRGSATWEAAATVLDDVAVATFERELAECLECAESTTAAGAALLVDGYAEEEAGLGVVLPPRPGEADEPVASLDWVAGAGAKDATSGGRSGSSARAAAEEGEEEGEEEEEEEEEEAEEAEEEEEEDTNVYDEEGRRLCNTFGCTLLNNHYGLHKLPVEPVPHAPRLPRTCARHRHTTNAHAAPHRALWVSVGCRAPSTMASPRPPPSPHRLETPWPACALLLSTGPLPCATQGRVARRTASKINFKRLASSGHNRAEIGEGRQLGKPDAVLAANRARLEAAAAAAAADGGAASSVIGPGPPGIQVGRY